MSKKVHLNNPYNLQLFRIIAEIRKLIIRQRNLAEEYSKDIPEYGIFAEDPYMKYLKESFLKLAEAKERQAIELESRLICYEV